MIIFQGGNSSGFSKSSSSPTLNDISLFHVKGSSALNTVAVQTASCSAASLNSSDSFILVNLSTVYTWLGTGSNEDEKIVATNIALGLAGSYNGSGGRSVVSLVEGKESEDFWTTLGGKSDYPKAPVFVDNNPRDARLFSASTATGVFKVEEVVLLHYYKNLFTFYYRWIILFSLISTMKMFSYWILSHLFSFGLDLNQLNRRKQKL
jgi:hypothetical protein